MIFGLEQWADSDAPALLDDSGESWLGYRDLTSALSREAAAIAGLGRPLAFLFGRNDIPSAVAYLACLEAGAPAASLRADLAPERIAALVKLYRPGLVCGIDPGPGYEPVPGLPLPAWRRLDGAVAAHPLLAQMLSTSGSTGSPRMVRLARTAVEANARSIRQALGIGSADRSLLNLPLSYSYGLSVLNSHLAAGASVLLTERGLNERLFWDRLAAHRVTSMPGVPYLYQTLKRLGFEALAPASLTTLTQAGGKLSDALVEHFHGLMRARGGGFFVMYGQTEATARIAILDSVDLPDRLGGGGGGRPVTAL
jgi:acyl-CoA synthetase (AMP-forming)/AMP-acid ligase II